MGRMRFMIPVATGNIDTHNMPDHTLQEPFQESVS